MALDFPNTPTDGEKSVQPNGVTYEWQATKERWISITTLGGSVVGGTVVQEQSIQDGALAQGTTIFPTGGNSIPVNTDGDEYMTIDFTPKYATSVLRVDVVWNGSNDVAVSNRQGMGLFQDAIVDALAATQSWADNAGESMIMSLTNFVAATDTALRTFKVRAGSNTAGTTDFNGTSGTQRFGGVYASTITVTEIQPNAIVEPILPSPLEIFINGVPVDSISGSEIDFAIPAGVKNVTIGFDHVGFSSSARLDCLLGTAGGIAITGYEAGSWRLGGTITSISGITDALPVYLNSPTEAYSGTVELVLLDAATNKWASSHTGYTGPTAVYGGGAVTLSDALTTVRISSGADTFATGTINIQYDNQGQEAQIVLDALANLYSEGTWTAVMEDSSLNQSSVSVTGNWVRQGNLVTCWFNDMDAIDVTGLTTVDSARITIPFPRDNTAGLPSGACVLDGVVLTGGHTWANTYLIGTAGGRMQIRESGGGDSDAAILISAFSGNDIKGATLTYMAVAE